MKRMLLICLAALLLLACVPTPEEEIVVNKGDGLLAEKIAEPAPVVSYTVELPQGQGASGEAKPTEAELPQNWPESGMDAEAEPEPVGTLRSVLGAPEHAAGEAEGKVWGGTLKVLIDADVEVPNVSAIPVFTVRKKEFSPAERERITKLLLGDGPYCDYNAALAKKTAKKRRIDLYVQRLAEYDDRVYGPDFPYDMNREVTELNLQSMMADYAEMPEPGPMQPWTGSFDAEKTVVADAENRYLCFSTDASVWMYDERHEPADWGNEGAIETDEEKAAASVASELFSLLSDADYRACFIEPDDDTRLRMQYGVPTERSAEYDVTLLRYFAGIPCYSYTAFHGSDTGMQAAGVTLDFDDPVFPETVAAHVRDGKVTAISWYNVVDVVRTENENVALLPFDNVLEIFKKQVFRSIYLDKAEKGSPETVEHLRITRVCLSYMKVKKKDAPNERYILPVWDFMGYVCDPSGKPQSVPSERFFWDQSFLTVNAIDGSIIDRAAGY